MRGWGGAGKKPETTKSEACREGQGRKDGPEPKTPVTRFMHTHGNEAAGDKGFTQTLSAVGIQSTDT